VSQFGGAADKGNQQTKNSSILDSAMRYEKVKRSSRGIDVFEPQETEHHTRVNVDQSNDVIAEQRAEYSEEKQQTVRQKHPPLISPDSRGLSLEHTEYYNPEENDEKVIKPSEFKVHRFSHRNDQINYGNAVKKPEETKPAVLKYDEGTTESSNEKLSLNDLKKKRAQERLKNSKKFSSSEPLLDRLDSDFSSPRETTTTPRRHNDIVRTTGSFGRKSKKKVEKWSNEIYTNTNVGKINIPDSFQTKPGGPNSNTGTGVEDYINEREKRSEDSYNERKHKREQNNNNSNTSNSSTPRASTPKKSRRRFSLTGLSDITESTTVPSTPTSKSRPASPSLGSRIKKAFSPRSKRKNKKSAAPETHPDLVDDDIMRRLNMNVNTSGKNRMSQSLTDLPGITSGHSSIRSRSGHDMAITGDEEFFGFDDHFLSTEEWLSSQRGNPVTRGNSSRRPEIKKSIIPTTNRSKQQNAAGSWKAQKNNIGKVTVPEVFSSRQTNGVIPGSAKFRTKSRSPVMIRKRNSRNAYDDVVFNSFDVDE